MDEADLKLQKASGELINEFANALQKLLRQRSAKIDKIDLLVELLEPFQEWPQIIDPHLRGLISPLVSCFLSNLDEIQRLRSLSTKVSGRTIPVWQAICRLLYTLCKVRGQKVIVQFLNNEPKYLEPMLAAYGALTDTETSRGSTENVGSFSSFWEEKYIVLLWLSHLMLTPFDLSSISSAKSKFDLPAQNDGLELPEGVPWIATHAIRLSIQHLAEPSKVREAAKIVLVRVALRPDLRKFDLFNILLQWALSSLNLPSFAGIFSKASPTYVSVGLLSFVAGLTIAADTAVIAPSLSMCFQSLLFLFQAYFLGTKI